MYGFKQAAILAHRRLVAHLKTFGYSLVPYSLTLWRHSSMKTTFCLCVDDFGFKHYSRSDALHLLNALKQAYPVTVNWEGKNYCRLTLASMAFAFAPLIGVQ